MLLRLFAPFMPFVTEEVWSWWRTGSVHRAAWPQADDLPAFEADTQALGHVGDVLGELRRAKTEAKVSQKTPITSVTVTVPEAVLAAAQGAESDIMAAGRVQTWTLSAGGEDITVADVEFEPAE